jgi:hypothetical protein
MSRLTATAVLILGLLATAGEQPTAEVRRIQQIMTAAHLKPQNRGTRNNLDNKLIDGKATDAEKKQLLELYQELGQLKPGRGDLDEWKARTTEMVAAVEAVIKGEEKAGERLAKARDCKSCHDKFRRVP